MLRCRKHETDSMNKPSQYSQYFDVRGQQCGMFHAQNAQNLNCQSTAGCLAVPPKQLAERYHTALETRKHMSWVATARPEKGMSMTSGTEIVPIIVPGPNLYPTGLTVGYGVAGTKVGFISRNDYNATAICRGVLTPAIRSFLQSERGPASLRSGGGLVVISLHVDRAFQPIRRHTSLGMRSGRPIAKAVLLRWCWRPASGFSMHIHVRL